MPTTSLIISTPGPDANCYLAAAVGDTPAEADAYFANTLRESAWTAWATKDREMALIQATQMIDALGGEWQRPPFGYFVVNQSEYDNENSSHGDKDRHVGRARFVGMPHLLTQNLHFPRIEDIGIDTAALVPKNVKAAVCEQAFYLLGKRDNPDLLPRTDLQSQGVKGISVDGLSESYGGTLVPDGIVLTAWTLMRPYIIRSLRVERRGRGDYA
jgi:hypothetical protein